MGATRRWFAPAGSIVVSILAHLAKWALHRVPRFVSPFDFRFNPRPPRKVGATQQGKRVQTIIESFNPRPPRKVGATKTSARLANLSFVSILAHLAKWALQFNVGSPGRFLIVSILAHLAKWALQCYEHGKSNAYKFQSSPTSQSGRYMQKLQSGTSRFLFQSSPTSQSGRYVNILHMRLLFFCFNPRPPRKVGATGEQSETDTA